MKLRVQLGWVAMVAAAAVATAAPETGHCSTKCKDEKEDPKLIDACHRGCDVFLAKDAAERNIFLNPFTALHRVNTRAALIKCTNDCNLTYNEGEAEACADGCRWQNDSGAARQRSSSLGQIINLGDNGGLTITLGSMPEMPRMPQGLSNLFNQVNDMVNDQIRVQHGNLQQIFGGPSSQPRMDPETGSSGHGMFGSMFDSMHQSMQDMMRGFLGGPNTLQSSSELEEGSRGKDGKLIHGGGELVVIKSGPGFHEEKKYMLGPNADIEKILDSNMNDMFSSVADKSISSESEDLVLPVQEIMLGEEPKLTLTNEPSELYDIDLIGDLIETEIESEEGSAAELLDEDNMFQILPPAIKDLIDRQDRIFTQMMKKENFVDVHPKVTNLMADHVSRMEHILNDNDQVKILIAPNKFAVSHQNPMEKYVDRDQVEVFGKPEEPEEVPRKSKAVFADSDPWGIINEGLEGPKLPETGLKSRQLEKNEEIEDLNRKMEEVFGQQHHQPRFIYVDRDVCAQEKSKMSWGDWFNCLHVRMGLPNWLLVSTVSLGVIFTLWLCLVIPSNPPKQKVRRSPKNVNVKELEANGALATIIMPPTNELEKVDLPPSYDDLMITAQLKKKEAEMADDDDGFSAKLVLEDDEEIVEPLPQKQNEANESNA